MATRMQFFKFLQKNIACFLHLALFAREFAKNIFEKSFGRRRITPQIALFSGSERVKAFFAILVALTTGDIFLHFLHFFSKKVKKDFCKFHFFHFCIFGIFGIFLRFQKIQKIPHRALNSIFLYKHVCI